MTKGEYLESIGLAIFGNPQFLKEEADDNYKRMADKLAESFAEIWKEEEDSEVRLMIKWLKGHWQEIMATVMLVEIIIWILLLLE